MARAYPWDTDDSTPVDASVHVVLLAERRTDNNWHDVDQRQLHRHQPARKGPNLGCGTPITPLTESRGTVEAGINAMRPWRRGGTTGNLGLVWGWRTISPTWRGLWGDADLPLDYGTDFMDKVVVHADRRQQRVLQPSRRHGGDSVDALRLHGLRPRQRARSGRARRRRPPAAASPSSTTA